jgi:hypothetical protein
MPDGDRERLVEEIARTSWSARVPAWIEVTSSRSAARLDFADEGAMLEIMVCLLLSIDRRVALGCASRPDDESAPQG